VIAIFLIGFGVAFAALAVALGLPVIAVIMIELLATATIGIVFLVLYLARRGDGYGVRDPDPQVREVAWHLILTTAAVVIESLSFTLLGFGLGVPEWIFAIVFGIIDTPTESVPEGMRRVLILSDPTLGMGSLAAAVDAGRERLVHVDDVAAHVGDGDQMRDRVERVLELPPRPHHVVEQLQVLDRAR